MANIKISDLTSAAAATGTQQFEVNESGTSKKVTGAQLATYIEGEISSSPTFTGQVSVDAGSASAPSITKTGDSNTGIYFPAADTIGLSTGGTLRVSVDASGNVGIGGASAGSKLHVNEGDISAIKSTGITQLTTSSGTVNSYLNANSGGVGTAGTSSNHQFWLMTNNTQRAVLGTDGTFVLTSSGGLGYGTGSGGTVTQTTSKSTAVTLNKYAGRITMNGAALAAGASVSFTLNNTAIDSFDCITLTGVWGFSPNYRIEVAGKATGVCSIRVTNISAGSLSEALEIDFVIIKGSNA